MIPEYPETEVVEVIESPDSQEVSFRRRLLVALGRVEGGATVALMELHQQLGDGVDWPCACVAVWP